MVALKAGPRESCQSLSLWGAGFCLRPAWLGRLERWVHATATDWEWSPWALGQRCPALLGRTLCLLLNYSSEKWRRRSLNPVRINLKYTYLCIKFLIYLLEYFKIIQTYGTIVTRGRCLNPREEWKANSIWSLLHGPRFNAWFHDLIYDKKLRGFVSYTPNIFSLDMPLLLSFIQENYHAIDIFYSIDVLKFSVNRIILPVVAVHSIPFNSSFLYPFWNQS